MDTFSEKYPNIAEWVFGGGWIEIGQTENCLSFVRALDEGGLAWEGAPEYRTLDAAFTALEEGLTRWVEENS